MTSLLFIISFLLHIIALFAIYQLFKEIQKLKKTHIEDLDELMTAYLDELREENARLESRLNNTRPAIQHAPLNLQSEEPEQRVEREDIKKADHQLKSDTPPAFSTPKIPVEQEDQYTTSLQSQILLLADQGLKPSEIAKQLDCGETEAALVMKLHKRKR